MRFICTKLINGAARDWPPPDRSYRATSPRCRPGIVARLGIRSEPFRRFYEALGGQRLSDKQINVGGVQLVEVAYGWPDARILVAGSLQ